MTVWITPIAGGDDKQEQKQEIKQNTGNLKHVNGFCNHSEDKRVAHTATTITNYYDQHNYQYYDYDYYYYCYYYYCYYYYY